MYYKTVLSEEILHRQNIFLRIIIFLLITIWISGFTSIQIFPSYNLSASYPFLKHIYSLVCHQQENKSFTLNGIHLFVCARCSGIYFGGLITAFIFLFIRKSIRINLKLFLLSILPIVLDVIFYSSGVYKYSKVIALCTGMFSGSAVFIYILNMLENFISELKTNE